MASHGFLLAAVVAIIVGSAMPGPVPFSQAVRHACQDDVRLFCPNLHDPVKILHCLQAHEQEVSTACASGLHHCPMYNCLDDIKQFCPEAEGTKGTLKCLWKHRSELSDKCWKQSIGSTKLGYLPESHVCREDEQEFCPDETSLLGAMNCLRQRQPELSPQCSRIVDSCRLFACVPEVQQTCPDVTSLSDMKGCIMQNFLQCSKSIESADAPNGSSSPYPFCRLETKNLCGDARPEELYDCLHGYENSVSKQCKKSLKESPEHRCKEERNSFCLHHFGQSLVKCLENVDTISVKCQKTLNEYTKKNPADQETHIDEELDSNSLEESYTFNILLTSLASFAFILMLVGVAYVVRKSRSMMPMDSLPSATTSTEYIRI